MLNTVKAKTQTPVDSLKCIFIIYWLFVRIQLFLRLIRKKRQDADLSNGDDRTYKKELCLKYLITELLSNFIDVFSVVEQGDIVEAEIGPYHKRCFVGRRLKSADSAQRFYNRRQSTLFFRFLLTLKCGSRAVNSFDLILFGRGTWHSWSSLRINSVFVGGAGGTPAMVSSGCGSSFGFSPFSSSLFFVFFPFFGGMENSTNKTRCF